MNYETSHLCNDWILMYNRWFQTLSVNIPLLLEFTFFYSPAHSGTTSTWLEVQLMDTTIHSQLASATFYQSCVETGDSLKSECK